MNEFVFSLLKDGRKPLLISLRVFLVALATVFLVSCFDDDEDEDNSEEIFMCASISGSELIVNCASSEIGGCDSGQIVNGTYDSHTDCAGDWDTVLNTWGNGGGLTLGPNSQENTSGGDSGGTGGGSLNCDVSDVWTGDPNDVQVSSLCQGACVYYDAGGTAEGDATCSVLAGYGATATNSCTVCN